MPYPYNYPNYPNFPQMYPQNNGVNWVQGIEGAKAYPVGAGNSVLLMDSDNQSMYIKSADQAGVPSLRIFEYKEITDKKPEPKLDMSQFVTREELEEALSKLAEKKKKKKREYDEDDDE